METGKIAIAVAIITMLGGLGTAVIANWDKISDNSNPIPNDSQHKTSDDLNITLQNKINELVLVQDELKNEQVKSSAQKILLDEKDKEIKVLKQQSFNINNTKLKQLLSFHNDTACYGRSLNFTHESDESYNHCVSKEILAKRFLKFFEELEIIENDGAADYSRARAKAELIKLQTQYKFTNTGWYTEFMLGILIIEYAKKA